MVLRLFHGGDFDAEIISSLYILVLIFVRGFAVGAFFVSLFDQGLRNL